MSSIDMEIFVDDKFVLHRVKFTILLVLQIAAIILSFLIFIFFVKHRAILKAPQNHGLLILLVLNSIQLIFDMPLVLHYYIRGYVSPATSVYCTWWTFFEYTIYAVSEYLLAVIAVQRHMFIFNQHVLRIRWMRNLLHHLPLLLCLVYPTVFYLFAIVLYPCDNNPWDYTNKLCGYANCYLLYDQRLASFDLLINNGMPVVIDIVANAVLIGRVVLQKRRARQSLRWHQQRHMMIQLFCLSTLYLTAWTPFLLVLVINVLRDPTFLNQIETDYFGDLLYMVYLFLPWMYLIFFPELTKWIMQCCRRRQLFNANGSMQPRNAVGVMKSHNAVGTIQSRNTVGIMQSHGAGQATQAPVS